MLGPTVAGTVALHHPLPGHHLHQQAGETIRSFTCGRAQISPSTTCTRARRAQIEDSAPGCRGSTAPDGTELRTGAALIEASLPRPVAALAH